MHVSITWSKTLVTIGVMSLEFALAGSISAVEVRNQHTPLLPDGSLQ